MTGEGVATMTGRALVTGAGKRLGRAMALHLARTGHDVAVHYATSRAGADDLVAEIAGIGRQAVALQADLLDERQTGTLIARAAAALDGPLTLLVNNASIFEHDDLDTMTRESWDRHIESNLRAPVRLTQDFAAQAPRAVPDARGEPVAQAQVINMIDQRVQKLTPEFMSYTVAKMGLWAFTRTSAQALAPHVRVNAIGPGRRCRAAPERGALRPPAAATVLGRGADADDICAALGYFLAAPAVTGQLLCIDGGQHLAWRTADILGVE